MVSLLAATSASAGAYAGTSADVSSYIKTTDAKQWTNATRLSSVGDTIVVSTGAEISRTLEGKLLPGTYKLTSEVTKQTTGDVITVNVNGTPLSSNTFKLDTESSVTITVISKNKKEYAVILKKLELVFDFTTAGNNLTTELAKVINKINNADSTALRNEATKIATTINIIKSSSSYDDYKSYELYNEDGYKSCTVMSLITELSKKVDAANKNDVAYQEFISAYEIILSNLTSVEKKLNAASAYAKTKYATDISTYSNNLKTDKTAADQAHDNATAGSIDVAAFTKKYDLTTLSKKIDAANLNDSAYNVVVDSITAFKAKYDVVLKNLISVLPSTNDVYGDILTKAQGELKAVVVTVNAAEKTNGTFEIHDGAAANINGASGTKAIVIKATDDIKNINKLYTDSATKLKGAYSKAIAAVTKRQSVLDGYLLTAKSIGKTYTNDSTTIQKAINDLSTKIETANKAHTIDVLNYSSDTLNIKKLEDAFGKIINAANDNYNYNAKTEALNTALTNALAEAKKVVDGYTSTDKAYTAKDRYPKTYQALSSQIKEYVNGAKNAYNSGKALTFYNSHLDSITADGFTSKAITAYQINAQKALTQYNTVAPAIAGYRTLYKQLVAIVTDKEVTDSHNVTYGSLLDGADKKITKLENALTAAVALKDSDHIKAIKDITLDPTITDNLKADTTNYKNDKNTYDKAISLNAAKSMLDQAKTSLGGMTKLLESYRTIYTPDTLGLSYDKIVKATLEVLITKVDDETTAVGNIKPADDATKAIATLSVVNDSISKLYGYITAMESAAKAAIANVSDNKKQMTNSNTVWQGYYDNLYGKANIKGVADLIVDPYKNLTEKISTLNKKLQEQKDSIAKAFAKETLVVKWNDSKDAKGKIIKGIGSLLNDINDSINTARNTAIGYAKNYNAYLADSTAYSKVDLTDSITNAKIYVSLKATDSAKTYFTGLLSTYETQNKQIKKDIKDLFDAIKSTTSTKQTEIKNLSAAVQKVVDDVIPNETAYAVNVKAIAATQKSWNALYDSLSVNDQSTAAKTYLAQLAVQQAAINALADSVEANFGKGASAGYDITAKKIIAGISKEIINIKNAQIQGYDTAIKNDNTNRYNTFLDAIGKTESAYNNAINTINGFNSIKNADLRAGLQSIIDANKSIYEYSSKIIGKKAEATKEYNRVQALTDPVIFDSNELFTDSALAFKDGINKALKVFTASVNTNAKHIFSDSLSYAKLALDGALSNIGDYNLSVKSSAFKTLKDTIAFAEAAENEVDYAIVIDKIIDNYTKVKINAMVDQGYIDAAAAEWKTLFDPINAQYNREIAVIKDYKYKDSSTDYAKNYDDLYSSKITSTAKNSTSALAKYNSVGGKLYTKLSDIKTDTAAFISGAKTIYDNAKSYNNGQVDNANAYAQMLLDIDTVQTTYNVVDKYVSAYVVKDSLFSYLAQNQGYITGLKADAESNKNKAVSYLPTLKANCIVKNDAIKNTIVYANQTEIRGLETAIGVLKTEYNTAASIKSISDSTIVAFKTKIDALGSGVGALKAKVYASTKQDTLQTGLLAMENTIALTRSDITNYYNNKLAVEAYGKLTAAANGVVKDYNNEADILKGYAKPVQNDYGDRLTNVNTVIAGIQKEIESRNSANTILFYNDGLTNAIKAIADSLKNVTAEITVAQAPFALNEKMFVKLTGEAKVFSDKITLIKGKLDGYITKAKYDYKSQIVAIDSLIKTDTTALRTTYNNVLLTAVSKLANSTEIATKLVTLESQVDHNESDSLIKNLRTSLDKAYGVFNKNKYTIDIKKTLNDTYDFIDKAITALDKYNSDAYNTEAISKDVDGKDLKDDKGNTVASKGIKYLTEADAVVFGKITALTIKVNTYTDDVKTNNYILGDVTHDGYVKISDYTAVLRIILGKDKVEAGSVTALAADANSDGEISIGDLTTIVNIIMGTKGNAAAKAIRLEEAKETIDALSLSSESEGTTQRIAINLTNVKSYVGCQMDIKLPVGMTLLTESLSNRTNGHELSSNDLSDGIHRVVISSENNNAFGTSENAILYLEVNAANSNDIDKIEISNIKFSDPNARVFNLADILSNETTGINAATVDQNNGTKIYSVGGSLMNAIKKGINIIRKADGSVQKIIKK